MKLGMTPGGGCKPGPRSIASAAAAAIAVALGFCVMVGDCMGDIAALVFLTGGRDPFHICENQGGRVGLVRRYAGRSGGPA